MSDFDLVVRGGTVVTAEDQFRADVGVRGGRVAALGEGLTGTETLDAGGFLVLPGGVDSHCHIEQPQEGNGADEETGETGSRSALAGGTTSVVTFSTQFKGGPVLPLLAEYRRRAERGAMADYAFQIVTDAVLAELAQVVAQGVRSFKAFLTYDPLRLDDRGYLRVLAAGLHAPKYHAWSRPPVVEREATHRAIALAELVD